MAPKSEKKRTPAAKVKIPSKYKLENPSQHSHKKVKRLCVESSWFLDKTRMVTVTKRNGKSFVVLRELTSCFFKPKNKGIDLSSREWKELTEHIGDIDKAVRIKSKCSIKLKKSQNCLRKPNLN